MQVFIVYFPLILSFSWVGACAYVLITTRSDFTHPVFHNFVLFSQKQPLKFNKLQASPSQELPQLEYISFSGERLDTFNLKLLLWEH